MNVCVIRLYRLSVQQCCASVICSLFIGRLPWNRVSLKLASNVVRFRKPFTYGLSYSEFVLNSSVWSRYTSHVSLHYLVKHTCINDRKLNYSLEQVLPPTNDKSQGTGIFATHLQCGGMFNCELLQITCEYMLKKFSKCVNIWPSFGQKGWLFYNLVHQGDVLLDSRNGINNHRTM